jgi:hypothetical protein
MNNWPEHGLLSIKVSESVVCRLSPEGAATNDNIHWYVLNETGRAMGVPVKRAVSAHDIALTIEFPRTVKRLEGVTAVEVDTASDPSGTHFKPLAGHRLLLVTDDARLSADIKTIARRMGVVTEVVSSPAQSVRFCEADPPHLIVIDERLRDAVFDELRADLKKTDPNFPVIEIAIKPNTLEVAGWTSGSTSRLSRDGLQSQFPSMLVMELAKVM